MAVQFPVNVIGGAKGGAVLVYEPGSPALGTTNAVHAAAAVLASGGPQVISTAITNPVIPRNVTATAGGTAGDIKAVQVTVTGTLPVLKGMLKLVVAWQPATPRLRSR